MDGFLERKFGDKVKIVPAPKTKESFLKRILNPEAKVEAIVGDVVAEVLDELEERLDEIIRWNTKFR